MSMKRTECSTSSLVELGETLARVTEKRAGCCCSKRVQGSKYELAGLVGELGADIRFPNTSELVSRTGITVPESGERAA